MLLFNNQFFDYSLFLIKFYSGGIHDGPGQAFTNLFFFIGLAPISSLLLTCFCAQERFESRKNHILFDIRRFDRLAHSEI
jgi:hypothetical protein